MAIALQLALLAARSGAQEPSIETIGDSLLDEGIHLLTLRLRPSAQRAPDFPVFVIDATRKACWRPIVLSPPDGQTLELVSGTAAISGYGRNMLVAANGDFFESSTSGLPTGLNVHGGAVVAGVFQRKYKSGLWPVFASRPDGTLTIAHIDASAWVRSGTDSVLLTAWNRPDSDGVAFLDQNHLSRTTFRSSLPPDWARLDAFGGTLLIGPRAPRLLTDTLRALLGKGGQLSTSVSEPIAEAMGGWPILVDGGVVRPEVANNAAPFFQARLRRSAVGFDRVQAHLFLVVSDAPGLSLIDLARVMVFLGADKALNLDGGPSSQLALRAQDGRFDSLVRGDPVGSALGIVKRCP
jgi:uncharacterized protein YigE (DUF2233 family)